MRILYIHQYFGTRSMSGGTRSYEMARRLVSYGHEVDMIASDTRQIAGEAGWKTTNENGIRVHWLGVKYDNSMGFYRRLLAFLRFAWGAASRAKQIDADIVFATSTPLFVAIPGVHASKKLGIPLVFEVRDLWPEVPISLGILNNRLVIEAARMLERYAYRHSDHIIALSPGMKAGIAATGYAESRISIIPNGADRDLFENNDEVAAAFRAKMSWLGDRPLVVYTGAIGLVNGVEYLAKVAAHSLEIDPNIRFLVIGSGGQEAFVRRAASKLGVLEENFFMLPPRPKAEIPAILAAASVATSLVINNASLFANSANKVFDALASGTPVAINYGGWQAEFLTESGAGIVLPATDEREAAHMLAAYIREERNLARAGDAALNLARTRFDREVLARKLEGVLAEQLKAAAG